MAEYFSLTNSLDDDTAGIDALNAWDAKQIKGVLESQAGQLKDLIKNYYDRTGHNMTITITDGSIVLTDDAV